MRNPLTRTTALFLLAATQAQTAAASPLVDRLNAALETARRTLSLQEFMLLKLQTIGDPGISPSYQAELEETARRVFEARAAVLALERALVELAGVAPGAAKRAVTKSVGGLDEAPAAADAPGPARPAPPLAPPPLPPAPPSAAAEPVELPTWAPGDLLPSP